MSNNAEKDYKHAQKENLSVVWAYFLDQKLCLWKLQYNYDKIPFAILIPTI